MFLSFEVDLTAVVTSDNTIVRYMTVTNRHDIVLHILLYINVNTILFSSKLTLQTLFGPNQFALKPRVYPKQTEGLQWL